LLADRLIPGCAALHPGYVTAIVAWDRSGPGFSPTSLEGCFYTAKAQRPTWPPALPTSAFGSTSDRSDFVSRQPLGWASPQPSAGSNRQRRRRTFLRRHAAWQALSPRPAEPAFEGHGVEQSAWPFHQRFEAKP